MLTCLFEYYCSNKKDMKFNVKFEKYVIFILSCDGFLR